MDADGTAWWILIDIGWYRLILMAKIDGYWISMSEAKIVVWSSLAKRLSTLAKIVVNVRRRILKISDNHCVIIDIGWSNILKHTYIIQRWYVQIQDQAMSLKFVEIGKVMLVWGILKNVSQVCQDHSTRVVQIQIQLYKGTNKVDANTNTNMQTQLVNIQMPMFKYRWYKYNKKCTNTNTNAQTRVVQVQVQLYKHSW